MSAPTPITARELLAQRFTEPRWAVPGILPEGLFLIAARPKMGKSWLMLNLSVAVAMGGRALGQVKVTRGAVLYLALEDTPRRLQSRLVTMLDDGHEAPELLELQTAWPRLDAGGLEAIGEWLGAHPNARIVIIDTLAKVRGRSKRRDASLYDEDYDALSGLKALADKHGVAIGVVHHQRKMGGGDVFDTISGTLGLTAGPDTILVLQRNRHENGAILEVTGRDIEEARYSLMWDGAIGSWTLTAEPVIDLSIERREIHDAVMAASGPARPSAVAEWTKRSKGSVRKLMWEMAGDGQLAGDGIGGYFLPASLPKTVTVVTGNGSNAGNGVGNAGEHDVTAVTRYSGMPQ